MSHSRDWLIREFLLLNSSVNDILLSGYYKKILKNKVSMYIFSQVNKQQLFIMYLNEVKSK